MKHACHANGCGREAHPEIPFCKDHFNTLPEAHRKRVWNERPKGRCGWCQMSGYGEWESLVNLGVAIVAHLEAPEYEPGDQWLDEHGFCWVGGIYDAISTMATAKKVVKKYGLTATEMSVAY